MSMHLGDGTVDSVYLHAQQAGPPQRGWATAVCRCCHGNGLVFRDADADARAYPHRPSVCHSAGGPVDRHNRGDMTDDWHCIAHFAIRFYCLSKWWSIYWLFFPPYFPTTVVYPVATGNKYCYTDFTALLNSSRTEMFSIWRDNILLEFYWNFFFSRDLVFVLTPGKYIVLCATDILFAMPDGTLLLLGCNV